MRPPIAWKSIVILLDSRGSFTASGETDWEDECIEGRSHRAGCLYRLERLARLRTMMYLLTGPTVTGVVSHKFVPASSEAYL